MFSDFNMLNLVAICKGNIVVLGTCGYNHTLYIQITLILAAGCVCAEP